jgi:hypothetical protein
LEIGEYFTIRPYELPQKKYALWYAVGRRFGPTAQSLIFQGLCSANHTVRIAEGIDYLLEPLKSFVAEFDVLLRFEK